MSAMVANSNLGWRASLLQHFTPALARNTSVTIVADPDGLLAEQRMLTELGGRGFDVLPFEDPVAFRYAYESQYRGRTDLPRPVVTVAGLDTDRLPFDLIDQARRASRILSFSLASLFPNLSPTVVAQLDREDLDRLYEAQHRHEPGSLGENATKDFILRHVFDVAPELIRSPADLLRVLVSRHYRGKRYPASLDERFINLLRQHHAFDAWPLESLVSDRAAFLSFLQEHWKPFVCTITGTPQSDPPERLGILPLDHPDIRVYLDNFFLEGLLKPVGDVPLAAVAGTWMAVGVIGDKDTDAATRFARLSEAIEQQIPEENAPHTEWQSFAPRFGEWNALRHRASTEQLSASVDSIGVLLGKIEDAFQRWMLKNFAALHNLSYYPKPVMVHHVPRLISHGFNADSDRAKHALVVVDGMAVDQWSVIREVLAGAWGKRVQLEEDAIFAWVPTLTAVSRQSIFAAEPPLYFAASIGTTAKEEQHWYRFWEDEGARHDQIRYVKQKSQEDDAVFAERVREHAEQPGCRIIGIVVNVVDEVLHGSVLGSSGLQVQIRHWVENGELRRLLEMLLDSGFRVYLTADHGNTQAVGFGKPNVGSVAEERGARVHVFPDDSVRQKVQHDYDGTVPWPTVGLPADYQPLLAPAGKAFVTQGKRVVCHGGATVEEVIVPFVRLMRAG